MAKRKRINEIESLSDALGESGGKVEIIIEGSVYDALLEAAEEMRVSPQGDEPDVVAEMVKKAIALLLESRGKLIILHDPRSGRQIKYRLWR